MRQDMSDWLLSECYKHAEECRSRATAEQDGPLRNHFFDMERQWLKMAEDVKSARWLEKSGAAGNVPQSDECGEEAPPKPGQD
jgi:hypothetical protein